MDALECSGELTLRPEVKKLLRQISPATIDRLLCIHQPKSRRRGGAPRAPSQLRKRIPVHTIWEGEKTAGYVELDLVLHCGESTKGPYLHTPNVVDVATALCEPAVAKPQPKGSEGPVGEDPQLPSVPAPWDRLGQ